jgi:hypothetical protein
MLNKEKKSYIMEHNRRFHCIHYIKTVSEISDINHACI